MARRRITITIEGHDSGVLLSEFLQQLQTIRVALSHTHRITDHADKPGALSYIVVDLRHQSPFTVILEEDITLTNGRQPPPVAEAFVAHIAAIQRKRARVPPIRDIDALESYRNIAAPLLKNISRVGISVGGKHVSLDKNYAGQINKVIGPDSFEHGSVSGRLDRVNFHNTTRFEIFPRVGPKKVVCHVPAALRPRIKEAIEEFVTVYGRLRFKQWDDHPYAIDIASPEDIEIHPPDSTLPTIMDVHGMAPNATGALSSEDFIEHLRNG